MSEAFKTYPPDLSEEGIKYLKSYISSWTAQHGLSVRPSTAQVPEEANPNHVLTTNAPVTLFPSPFPRPCFDQAQNLQKIYNELYAGIASNEEWLEAIMRESVVL